MMSPSSVPSQYDEKHRSVLKKIEKDRKEAQEVRRQCQGLQDPTTRTTTRTTKNEMFNRQNNNFARTSRFLVHFFPVFARLRRETA